MIYRKFLLIIFDKKFIFLIKIIYYKSKLNFLKIHNLKSI